MHLPSNIKCVSNFTNLAMVLVQTERYKAVCDGCSECMGACDIMNKMKAPQCNPALDHTTSVGGGVVLEELIIKAGYWRATETTETIRECFNHAACEENITGSSGNCALGYEGPCECPVLIIKKQRLLFFSFCFLVLLLVLVMGTGDDVREFCIYPSVSRSSSRCGSKWVLYPLRHYLVSCTFTYRMFPVR